MRGRPRKMTLAALADMAAQGMTIAQAAAALSCTYDSVRTRASQWGIKFTRTRRVGRPPRVSSNSVRDAAARGLTQVEAARDLGISQCYVSRLARDLGLTFRQIPGTRGCKKPPDARAYRMAALYREGFTLEQIGKQYGVTRERARQVMTKYFNMRADGGGQHVLTLKNRERRRAAKDEASLKHWGCSYAQYRALQGKPTYAFCRQKVNAAKRGIGWELTLWQWWTIWQESGHWSERGRGQGYCMSRKGDVGPYAVGNVFIALSRENSSNNKNKKSKLPMGVRLIVKGNYRTYFAQRCIGGKQKALGCFKTPEEAYAAYLAADPGIAPSFEPQSTYPVSDPYPIPSDGVCLA